MQRRISAKVYPIEGRGRLTASILIGLGFNVFRIDRTMSVEGPPHLWREVFGVSGPSADSLVIPEDLAGLVGRVVFTKSRTSGARNEGQALSEPDADKR